MYYAYVTLVYTEQTFTTHLGSRVVESINGQEPFTSQELLKIGQVD